MLLTAGRGAPVTEPVGKRRKFSGIVATMRRLFGLGLHAGGYDIGMPWPPATSMRLSRVQARSLSAAHQSASNDCAAASCHRRRPRPWKPWYGWRRPCRFAGADAPWTRLRWACWPSAGGSCRWFYHCSCCAPCNGFMPHRHSRLTRGAAERFRRRAGIGSKLERFRMPDLVGILGDGAVRREYAHAGHIQDGLPGPLVGLAVKIVDPVLRFHVAAEVGQQQVVVAEVHQQIEQLLEATRFFRREHAVADLVQHLAQFGIGVIQLPWLVAVGTDVGHLRRGGAEDEDVLLADLLHDL